MKKPDVSLILPCFNEAGIFRESVKNITDTLQLFKYEYEIIFVDDGSVDGTQDLIKRTKYRAIYHTVNQGRGKTVADGIRLARGDVVGYIDIDCEVSPVYIAQMVALIKQKKADIVIGKRVYRTTMGGVLREVLSRGYMWVAHMMIGTGGLDTETGYKFFNRSKILPIINTMEHKGWFWDTEIIVRSQKNNLKIIEVPVLFLRRFDKKSTVRIIPDIIDYMIHLWRFRRALKKL